MGENRMHGCCHPDVDETAAGLTGQGLGEIQSPLSHRRGFGGDREEDPRTREMQLVGYPRHGEPQSSAQQSDGVPPMVILGTGDDPPEGIDVLPRRPQGQTDPTSFPRPWTAAHHLEGAIRAHPSPGPPAPRACPLDKQVRRGIHQSHIRTMGTFHPEVSLGPKVSITRGRRWR